MKHNVNGNTAGVRDSLLARLDALYSVELEEGEFLPRELMQLLAECSCALNREIAVYITRDGGIVNVAIGTDSDVELTDYRLRRSVNRLSRVRCVHTHPDGDGRLSDVDLSALKIFRYDAMTAVGVKGGEPVSVQTAFLVEDAQFLIPPPVRWYRLPETEWLAQITESDRLVGREETEAPEDSAEKPCSWALRARNPWKNWPAWRKPPGRRWSAASCRSGTSRTPPCISARAAPRNWRGNARRWRRTCASLTRN